MAEETWQRARLIPTSGITGADEQERRATSALLAVIGSVKEFGRVLTKELGAPAGPIEVYTEVPFKLNGRAFRPDGLIRISRGGKDWVALVEVKTGRANLGPEQLDAYIDIAREQGFDALVTISNEIAANPTIHPTDGIDRRKLRKVSLHHWSWSKVLSVAVMQKEHRGVADPDQAWILGELIRYLQHPKSGALDFDDMGSDWVAVREAVSTGTLRKSDMDAIGHVTSRFDGLMRFAALYLGRRLGADVQQKMSRKEQADPQVRRQALANNLLADGKLSASIRIPNTVGDIEITVDMRAKRVIVHVDVDAPKSGRNLTRVNWLVRQLKDAQSPLRIEAFALNARTGTAEMLSAVREDPSILVGDASKDLVRFRVALVAHMGLKRGTGTGAFIDGVLGSLDTFYEEVVQNLKVWAAPPPQIPAPTPPAPDADGDERSGVETPAAGEPSARDPRPQSDIWKPWDVTPHWRTDDD